MTTIKYDQPNDPNAGRLIESLRHLGYDNYVAVADIVDNSIDADADLIKIRIWTEGGHFRILVGDNGVGMDRDILDQALRLGSLTLRDPVSDLGKFGMGLVTAGLSLARQTKVITRQHNAYITSVADVDEVVKTNTFCKSLGNASLEEKKLIDELFPEADSATVVIFDKCDGIRNQNTSVFANTLRKHLGRIHRYFIEAKKTIIVNDEIVNKIDPLEIDNPGTEIFSDDEYPVEVKVEGKVKQEKIRIRIALLAEDFAGGEREIALGIKNQGFYILRNNREIKAADTLDAFTKHNDFNRMRGEVFLTGDLDKVVGIDFTKRDIVLDQSFKDQLLSYLKPQCTTIKRHESGRTRSKESVDIEQLHEQARKQIDQKAKLLITPKTEIEKRGPRQREAGQVVPGNGRKERKNLVQTHSAIARRCEFTTARLGATGQIYECDLRGRVIVIRWNADHPFYQRFILDQRSDGRLVTAVDFLIYSMASAELNTLDDDQRELIDNFKMIISTNVRTLFS